MEKIVILSNALLGILQFRKELFIELGKDPDKRIFLLSPKGKEEERLISEILRTNVSYYEIHMNRRSLNVFNEFSVLRQYYRHFKRIKPDIVLTYTIKPNFYGGLLCRWLGIKYIATVTGLGTAFQSDNWLKKCAVFFGRIALKKAYKVFFQNEINRNIYLDNKIVDIAQIRLVMGSGVNFDRFQANILMKSKEICILFVGRIMQEKGIDEYLSAACILKSKYSKIQFEILGPFEEEKYKSIIEDLSAKGIIKYLGISKDVREQLKDVHCLINPSWHEGMSNVLLEAGAMKRFLIASDIPGCREIVLDNQTGFTFPAKNVEKLQECVERLIALSENEYEDFINRSYQHIQKNFSRDVVVNKYIETINKIIEERNAERITG